MRQRQAPEAGDPRRSSYAAWAQTSQASVPKFSFLRTFANSQAAACASADMLSVPGTRERTSPPRAYALAAAVHLAAAAAPGPGVARAAACRSAVAAIHAGGGKSGGRAEALPGRGPLPAMMLQSQHCSTSAVTRACMLTKNTDAQEPCTWPEQHSAGGSRGSKKCSPRQACSRHSKKETQDLPTSAHTATPAKGSAYGVQRRRASSMLKQRMHRNDTAPEKGATISFTPHICPHGITPHSADARHAESAAAGRSQRRKAGKSQDRKSVV